MRLFVAANLPDEIKENLVILAKRLKYRVPDVSWVQKENFHLTLKFIGDTAESKLENIENGISLALKGSKPFDLSLAGIGAFPEIKYPRVIWAGVTSGANELKALAEKIEAGLQPLGFDKEKREFSSHLTMGRPKHPKPLDFDLKDYSGNLGAFRLEHIELMQSSLSDEGPEYKILKSFPLGE